jgi:transcriptional regulator with XRE-family HTH domain
VSVISKRFADELNDKRMRDAYLSAQTRTRLVNQIRALRDQRGWSQGEFASRLGKPQSNVSRLENREYGNFSLKTLFELAHAFDVGLLVEFVRYDEFLRRTHDLSSVRLQVPRFSATALDALRREPDVMPSEAGGVPLFVNRLIQQEGSAEPPTVLNRLLGVNTNSAFQGDTVLFRFGLNANVPATNVISARRRAGDVSLPEAPTNVPKISGALDWLQGQRPVRAQSTLITDADIEAATVPFLKPQTQTVGLIL